MNKTYTVQFAEGLHARPASQFIQLVKDFTGDVQIEKDGKSVNGKSMIHIMTLGAKQGSELTVTATGDEAEATALFEKLDEFFTA
jgi:phosphocarrier protein HPr